MISLDVIHSYDDDYYYDRLIVRGRNFQATRNNIYKVIFEYNQHDWDVTELIVVRKKQFSTVVMIWVKKEKMKEV